MPIIHYTNDSEGVQPRPNDQRLQENWEDIAQIIPSHSLPVSLFPVRENLFRSNIPFPQQFGPLHELGIRHIIALTECRNLYQQAQDRGELPSDMTVHHNPYNQRHFLTLAELVKLCQLIHTCQKTGGVLVHCIAGMTRTGLVVSAYIAAILGHEPIDNLNGGIGILHLLRRWYDFITVSGGVVDPVHREAMFTRFAAISVLAQKHNIPIPKFLRPHEGTVNINALKEIMGFGDLPDLLPHIRPHTSGVTASPTSLPHIQTELQRRSCNSETPSMAESLTT